MDFIVREHKSDLDRVYGNEAKGQVLVIANNQNIRVWDANIKEYKVLKYEYLDRVDFYHGGLRLFIDENEFPSDIGLKVSECNNESIVDIFTIKPLNYNKKYVCMRLNNLIEKNK